MSVFYVFCVSGSGVDGLVCLFAVGVSGLGLFLAAALVFLCGGGLMQVGTVVV